MERFKNAEKELEKILPEDWHNIPAPLVEAIEILKKFTKLCAETVVNLEGSMEEFELKLNKKFTVFQTHIGDFSEKIKEIEINSQNTAKITKLKINEVKESLENKMEDDIRLEKQNLEIKIKDVRDQIIGVNKKLDSVPKMNQVQEMIQQFVNSAIEAGTSNINSKLIIPLSDSLNQKINLLNMYWIYREYDSRLQVADARSGKIEENVKVFTKNMQKAIQDIEDSVASSEVANEEKVSILSSKVSKHQEEGRGFNTYISQSLSSTQKSLEKAVNDMKSFQQTQDSFEDSLRNLSFSIKALENRQPSRPISPILSVSSSSSAPIPASAPVPVPKNTFSTEEITSKLEDLQKNLENLISQEKNAIFDQLAEHLKTWKSDDKVKIEEHEKNILELKDKLSWLPMNLTLMKDMSPVDARLFTIEARIRTEENARIQGFKQLNSYLQTVLNQQAELNMDEEEEFKPVLPVVETSYAMKNIEKKTAPGGMCTSEFWKGQNLEKKGLVENESVYGVRVKYNTPMPDVESPKDHSIRSKSTKKNYLFPSINNHETVKLPRMQSVFASNTINSKTMKY